jgi:pimeloyl-[acyl-carrier protein] methyl ester esterase
LVIAGDRDALVPVAASEYLATHLHAARFHPIPRAAHAPFLSHADEFCATVGSFLAGTGPSTSESAS